jgi:hypothetical protein
MSAAATTSSGITQYCQLREKDGALSAARWAESAIPRVVEPAACTVWLAVEVAAFAAPPSESSKPVPANNLPKPLCGVDELLSTAGLRRNAAERSQDSRHCSRNCGRGFVAVQAQRSSNACDYIRCQEPHHE